MSSLLVGGFFLEAGAANGEIYSDSLHFELNMGWTVRSKKKFSRKFFSIRNADPDPGAN
jgi:hypothetical protein